MNEYNSYKIDDQKLQEIGEELNNIITEENIGYNRKTTESTQFKYPNNNFDSNRNYNLNYPNKNYKINHNSIGTKESGVYDYINQFRDKQNTIEQKLNEVNKFKMEIENKNRKINELENTIINQKFEIEKFINRSEENLKLNQFWENTFKDFKNKLTKLEDEKIKLKEEIEKSKTNFEDLQFKYELVNEKLKSKDENLNSFKKIQNDYEKSLQDIQKEYKIKEENFKKKYQEKEDQICNKMKQIEKEYKIETETLLEIIKSLESDIDQEKNKLNELNDKYEEKIFEMKTREVEYNLKIDEKDKKIKEIETDLDNITREANEQIVELGDDIQKINKNISDNDIFYSGRIKELENKLKEELKRNEEYIKIINVYEDSTKNVPIINERDNSHYSINKSKIAHFDEEKIKLEKEIQFLKKLLLSKQTEVDKLQSDLNKTFTNLNNSGMITKNKNEMHILNLETELHRRNEEIRLYTNSNLDLENENLNLINELKYQNANFDKSSYEYKCEINKKNEEIHFIKLNYEKIIDELQMKLNNVFY